MTEAYLTPGLRDSVRSRNDEVLAPSEVQACGGRGAEPYGDMIAARLVIVVS
jgi:hypothetical protein